LGKHGWKDLLAYWIPSLALDIFITAELLAQKIKNLQKNETGSVK